MGEEVVFKNELCINVDTSRKDVVQIAKPDHIKQPSNNAEAAGMVIDDMYTLAEAMAVLIQVADASGYKNKDQSIKDITDHLTKTVDAYEASKVDNDTSKSEKEDNTEEGVESKDNKEE